MAAVTDNFDRADANPLSGFQTPWAKARSADDAFRITSNRARMNNIANDASSVYQDGTSFAADQYSETTVYGASGGTGTGMGLIVRSLTGEPANGAFYRITADVGGSTVDVGKFNPSFTAIGSSISSSFAAGDVLRVEMSGSTITVYKNGVSAGTRTDSAITSGNPGVGYSSAATGTPEIDNWSGGDLVATTITVIDIFDPIPFMSTGRI